MQFCHDLFSNFIDAYEALGVDAEYRATIAAMRARLPDGDRVCKFANEFIRHNVFANQWASIHRSRSTAASGMPAV